VYGFEGFIEPGRCVVGAGTVWVMPSFPGSPTIINMDRSYRHNPTHISSQERLSSFANRLIHSTFYKVFYVSMALASIVCVILSTFETCPSGWFYILELFINIGMICEVGVRYLALGLNFWRSRWNQLDVGLVLLCAVTLIFLFTGVCSKTRTREAEFDSILLVIRNVGQFSRLVSVLNKNRTQLSTRSEDLDFDSIGDDSMGALIARDDLMLGGDTLGNGRAATRNAPYRDEYQDENYF